MKLFGTILVFALFGCSYFEDEPSEEVQNQEMDEASQEGASDDMMQAAAAQSQESDDDEEEEEEVEVEYRMIEALKNQVSDMKLDQAKLWTRMDRLERELQAVREKTHLLRKGLMTGIAPLGLSEVESDPLMMDEALDSTRKSLASSADQKDQYAQQYAKARSLFDQADYGKAFLEFSQIKKKFSAKVHNYEPFYWMGRCWFLLKDYHKAKDHFEKFLAQQPESGWAPMAKLEIAQAELKMGLRQNAIKRLKNLIQDHPYESSTASARAILSDLGRNI